MRQDSVEKNKWYADEGKFFRRISDHLIVGDYIVLGIVNYINGIKLYFPKQEVITDYEEIDDKVLEAEEAHNKEVDYQKYKEYVNVLIRQKYSLAEELAIQRQRDEKPDEFKIFYAYCEQCKEIAKKKYNL